MGDQDFPIERNWYIGNACYAILYGAQLCMFTLSAYFISRGNGKDKSKYLYIAYSFTLLILETIAMAADLFYGQMMWIEHRDDPGGPVAYFAEHIADWYNTFGTAANVTEDFMSNALMLYRAYIFYSRPGSKWMLYFPGLLFLAATAMSIAATIQSGLPGGDFFHGTTTNFTIPWLVLTITFNIITTAMISIRLFQMSKSVRNLLSKERAGVYTSVIAILIESAAPFTILGIVTLGVYIKNLPEALFFTDVWGGLVSFTPQAIILRVAMGSAWNKHMVSEYTGAAQSGNTVVFAGSGNTHETRTAAGSATALDSLSRSKGSGKGSELELAKVGEGEF
ncbi:hypothetical protein HMN09_00337400 [Mycena chlorophos]|uniref:Uncharacterized protein n=1 Tax=Mycena chlorophos TaxID=658473 RepID=A0A8H6WHW8_MYCCL|nr:hypothetical protein HMN09_00337400 [Mycena chlorophos]